MEELNKTIFLNGSETLRADFHLHTRADKEFKYAGEENSFVKSYVEKLDSEKIKIGVITNHNKFDLNEYKALKKEAKKHNIFLLPGVELSVKEGANGVHTLIVFNPNEWLSNGKDDISSSISSLFLGIPNFENENTRCNKDLNGVIETLDSLGKDYFIIFAHIEQNSGLYEECDGGLITSLAQKANFQKRVLGLQKVRSRDKANNLKDWMGYELAHVEGSDPKSIEEIGKGQVYTYLKIGEYSYEAIKYAFRAYKDRIFDHEETSTHSYIAEMKCIGGKLDNQCMYPSSELNTLIGVRGSGKSSILEVLRYALEIEAAEPDNKYKKNLVETVVGSGGKIELLIKDTSNRIFKLCRIKGEEAELFNENGDKIPLHVSDVLKNPLYFGQKDLALTRAGYEMELLDKLVGVNAVNITSELNNTDDKIEKIIDDYISVSDIPEKIIELNAKNEELKHKLNVFKEFGIDDKLKKQTTCNEDLAKLSDTFIKLNNIKSRLCQICTLEEDLGLENYNSEYNKDIFDKATGEVKSIIANIDDINSICMLMEENLEKFADTKDSLKEKINSLKEEFAEIKREISEENIDVDSYVLYQKQLTENKTNIKNLEIKLKTKEQLEQSIEQLIKTRNSVLQKEFETYEKNIKQINESQDELKINIIFLGEKEKFKNEILTVFKGTGINANKADLLVNKFKDFLGLVYDYYFNKGIELKEILTDSMYSKMADVLSDNYKEIFRKRVSNKIEIIYHDKPLSRHSLGQRASALILFILTQSDSDIIIIDQPEDDLDNQVIYKELIQTIQEKKKDIQFIFATHNANIPVLGDAEKVIVTTYDMDDEKILLEQGSIDSNIIHNKIVDIMEGGEEAFTRRKEIYNCW